MTLSKHWESISHIFFLIMQESIAALTLWLLTDLLLGVAMKKRNLKALIN